MAERSPEVRAAGGRRRSSAAPPAVSTAPRVGLSRALRGGRTFVLAMLASGLAGCGSRAGLDRVDAAGQSLGARMATAVEAMSRQDADALRACRGDLVRLRLETTAVAISGPAMELRDTLTVAIDAVAEALDATARGLQKQAEAESAGDLAAGASALRQATADLELGERRLTSALATIERFREMRARLGLGR